MRVMLLLLPNPGHCGGEVMLMLMMVVMSIMGLVVVMVVMTS